MWGTPVAHPFALSYDKFNFQGLPSDLEARWASRLASPLASPLALNASLGNGRRQATVNTKVMVLHTSCRIREIISNVADLFRNFSK